MLLGWFALPYTFTAACKAVPPPTAVRLLAQCRPYDGVSTYYYVYNALFCHVAAGDTFFRQFVFVLVAD
jgi:hypothetical protein